ncbi:MAG: hypothetical protein ACK5MA_02060 [Parachlamydiaceae bacterium]
MSKFFKPLFCIFFFYVCEIFGYPADISYLVSDFKYSQEHGIKICEVQHGSLSALLGDLFIEGGDGKISPKIAEYFSQFLMEKWTLSSIYPPLKRSLAANGWNLSLPFRKLLQDPTFLTCAVSPPLDPSLILSYGGIVYADQSIVQDYNSYCKAYPGILFLNAAIFPYWRDKYKMNALFELDDKLKQYKAEWRLYPKKYDAQLADRIQEEMPSEFYVIKPRREFLGNGVLIISSDELDQVLSMILEPTASLKKHPDEKYSFWTKNREDSFLIEKYYRSDYIHLSSKNHYDATMRLVFILKYDEGKMSYHCMGGYWKLPCKAIEEEGTLNEKHISFGDPPFYKAIDQELFNEVNAQMERAMLLLYDKMLSK